MVHNPGLDAWIHGFSVTGNWGYAVSPTDLQNNLVTGHGISSCIRSQSLHPSKCKMNNLTPSGVQYLPRNTELVNGNLKLKQQCLYSQHSVKSLYLGAILSYYSSFSKQRSLCWNKSENKVFTPNANFSLPKPFWVSFAICSKFSLCIHHCCQCVEILVTSANISQAWWHGILPGAGIWLIPESWCDSIDELWCIFEVLWNYTQEQTVAA